MKLSDFIDEITEYDKKEMLEDRYRHRFFYALSFELQHSA